MKRNKIKIGIVGLGNRGREGLLRTLLLMPEVEIVALCDLIEERLEKSKEIVKEKRGSVPVVYTVFDDFLKDENVEAVVIASSWDEHTRMAVASMKAGKYTAVEVAGAYDIEDCWQLVHTYEETKTPIMLLENCCFGRFELLSTSLARAGKLGKVLYCHGAYTHELRDEILGGEVNKHYRLKNYQFRNCENYPTHELGPIAKLLNINRGNKMLSISSVASKGGVGLEEFTYDPRNPDPALKGTQFAQGDIVITTIICANGEIITLKLDTTLPSTYSREFTVRGTKGMCWQDPRMVLLESDANFHSCFDSDKNVEKYMRSDEKYFDYLPEIWRDFDGTKYGHGGMDFHVLNAFVQAVLNEEEMPIDVYDMAAWMAITPLSEQSIAHGGMPQAVPDFTRGKWFLRKTKDVVEFPKVEEKTEDIKNEFGCSRA